MKSTPCTAAYRMEIDGVLTAPICAFPARLGDKRLTLLHLNGTREVRRNPKFLTRAEILAGHQYRTYVAPRTWEVVTLTPDGDPAR